jgi:hypothetical protein
MKVVYAATGNIEGPWTYDQLTSTTAANSQYYSVNHNRLVDLDNGDKLFIAGRNANNSGCGGSFGNGYGIVIYPDPPNYYSNPKMMVMGWKGGMNNVARNFTGWSAATEISWNNGNPMNTCQGGVTGFDGTFTLTVAN